MPSLGAWWAVLAGVVLGIFLSGLSLSFRRAPSKKRVQRLKAWPGRLTEEEFRFIERFAVRKAGLWRIAAAAIFAAVLAFFLLSSPDAPHVLDWTNQQFDKLFGKKLGG